jgi:hypothetical protein
MGRVVCQVPLVQLDENVCADVVSSLDLTDGFP